MVTFFNCLTRTPIVVWRYIWPLLLLGSIGYLTFSDSVLANSFDFTTFVLAAFPFDNLWKRVEKKWGFVTILDTEKVSEYYRNLIDQFLQAKTEQDKKAVKISLGKLLLEIISNAKELFNPRHPFSWINWLEIERDYFAKLINQAAIIYVGLRKMTGDIVTKGNHADFSEQVEKEILLQVVQGVKETDPEKWLKANLPETIERPAERPTLDLSETIKYIENIERRSINPGPRSLPASTADAKKLFETSKALQDAPVFRWNGREAINWIRERQVDNKDLSQYSLSYLIVALWTGGKTLWDHESTLGEWLMSSSAADYALEKEKAIRKDIEQVWKKLDKYSKESLLENPMRIESRDMLHSGIDSMRDFRHGREIISFAMEFYGGELIKKLASKRGGSHHDSTASILGKKFWKEAPVLELAFGLPFLIMAARPILKRTAQFLVKLGLADDSLLDAAANLKKTDKGSLRIGAAGSLALISWLAAAMVFGVWWLWPLGVGIWMASAGYVFQRVHDRFAELVRGTRGWNTAYVDIDGMIPQFFNKDKGGLSRGDKFRLFLVGSALAGVTVAPALLFLSGMTLPFLPSLGEVSGILGWTGVSLTLAGTGLLANIVLHFIYNALVVSGILKHSPVASIPNDLTLGEDRPNKNEEQIKSLFLAATGSQGEIEVQEFEKNGKGFYMVKTHKGIFRFETENKSTKRGVREYIRDEAGNKWVIDENNEIKQMKSSRRLIKPVPFLLSDNFLDTWTHKELPEMAEKVINRIINDNSYDNKIIAALKKLQNEITAGDKIETLPKNTKGNDADFWNKKVAKGLIGKEWNGDLPQLSTISYFFRLISETNKNTRGKNKNLIFNLWSLLALTSLAVIAQLLGYHTPALPHVQQLGFTVPGNLQELVTFWLAASVAGSIILGILASTRLYKLIWNVTSISRAKLKLSKNFEPVAAQDKNFPPQPPFGSGQQKVLHSRGYDLSYRRMDSDYNNAVNSGWNEIQEIPVTGNNDGMFSFAKQGNLEDE